MTDRIAKRRALDDLTLPPLVDVEWVGGRVTLPAPAGAPDTPRGAGQAVIEADLWIEMPHGVVVGALPVEPDDVASAAGSLFRAMVDPGAGFPRRPTRVRVADPAMAADLESVMRDSAVTVAPVPELQAAREAMAATLGGGLDPHASYLEGNTIPEETVARLFETAAALHGGMPLAGFPGAFELSFEIVAERPALGCMFIESGEDGATAVSLFASRDALDAHLVAFEEMDLGATVLDLGAPVLSLGLVRRDELPDTMRRETASHGWRVAAASAYPLVEFRDRFGMPLALMEDDLSTLIDCVRGLLAFADEHGPRLARDVDAELEGDYPLGEKARIRIALINDALDRDDDPLEPLVLGPKVGRNDPCPCGSGRKYKKCCLPEDEARGRIGRPLTH